MRGAPVHSHGRGSDRQACGQRGLAGRVRSGVPGLILPMRAGQELDLVEELVAPRLERAIGVVYRPETELASHYFEAELPRQFNEYIWFDESRAVTPFRTNDVAGMPDIYPFAL